jgi:hypothetical protein
MKKFQKLSRAEMKNVMGGQPVPPQCNVGSSCVGVDPVTHLFVTGSCSGACECSVSNEGQRNDCTLD